MEFTVKRSDLVRELALVKNAVEVKTTTPILSHVLIETGEGCINLTSTDLELGMRCSCPATVDRHGKCALPAKRLLAYVSLLPDADVTINVKIGANNWASLTCGRSKARIAGLGSESFPQLPPTPPATFSVPVVALADNSIGKVSFAISAEESRFTLKGALCRMSAGGFIMAATDGHRLAVVDSTKGSSGIDGKIQVIVPTKALSQLQQLAKDSPDSTAHFSEDDNHIFYVVGTHTLIVRKLSGNFPDYERLMPKDIPHVTTVKREDLKAAIERVSQFSDERSRMVKVAVGDGAITITAATTEQGDSEESVEASTAEGSISIGFNATYLLDFLKASNAEYVLVMLKDGNSAAQFQPSTESDYKYVVMPMRI